MNNKEDGLKLLKSLKHVKWNIAARTYGNNHATLLGLIIEWWNSMREDHWSMDGAPGCYEGQNSINCDAILFEGDNTFITVEVEGTNPLDKLKTLEGYFKPTRKDLGPSKIAILLLFDYSSGTHDANTVIEKIKEITMRYPEKWLILVKLLKRKTFDDTRIKLKNSVL